MRDENGRGMDRRRFLATAGLGAAALGLSGLPRAGVAASPKKSSEIVLPALPYAEDALEPHVSARTLSIHHGKHHAGYVRKTNEKIRGTRYEGRPLEEIIRLSWQRPADEAVFQNAAQVWNHSFYWQSMHPKGGGEPEGALKKRIEADFGSVDALKKALVDTAASQFGTGWGWLVEKDGKLLVIKTEDATTPLVLKSRPLLALDVWEHAYYLDYQNERKRYLEAFVDHLVNWDFAARNLGA